MRRELRRIAPYRHARTYTELLGSAALGTARIFGRDNGTQYVALDFPPSADPAPRYGRPPHPALSALLERNLETYADRLRLVARYSDDLRRIPAAPTSPDAPFWDTGWLPFNTASLYALLRDHAPQRYVEIGSGNTTMVASRARADGGFPMRITSLDPSPRLEIDRLCDDVVRRPLEGADLALFGELQEGDVVVMDGSHRVFENSDATVFFLDVLPDLAPGILVGVHDIFLPYDYPTGWDDRLYSEEYLLAAYLIGGANVEPVLPCFFASREPELRVRLEPPWQRLPVGADRADGVFFWLRTA